MEEITIDTSLDRDSQDQPSQTHWQFEMCMKHVIASCFCIFYYVTCVLQNH